MKRLCIALFLLFVLPNFIQAQTTEKISLIVLNCKVNQEGGTCIKQEIFRYIFVNGIYVSKEKILESEYLPNSLNEWRIYKNRYAISESGDIIDIETKEFLHIGKGELFAIEGNLVFEKIDEWMAILKKSKIKGIFAFDLETRKYEKVKSNNIWKSNRLLSPDKNKTVRYLKDKGLQISRLGKAKKIIKVSLSVNNNKDNCANNPTLPLIWIDNEQVLTQKSNGELIIVDSDGNISPIINLQNEPSCTPTLERDVEGNLIYHYANTHYLIDVETKSSKKITFDKMGNGFTEKFEFYNEESGRNAYSYFFYDVKIGEFMSDKVKTANGYIAVEYRNEQKDNVYPAGIKIWNAIKKDWTTIDIEWLPKIIGWLED